MSFGSLLHFCRNLQEEKKKKKNNIIMLKSTTKALNRRLKNDEDIEFDEDNRRRRRRYRRLRQTTVLKLAKCQSIVEVKLKLFVMNDIHFIVFISTTEHNQPGSM